MLSCLGARIDAFPKGSRLLRAGEAVEEVRVLCWRAAPSSCREDIWETATFSQDRAGADLRGGVRLAPGSGSQCERGSGERGDGDVLHIKRVLSMCPPPAPHHNRIIRNLLSELARRTCGSTKGSPTWASAQRGQS